MAEQNDKKSPLEKHVSRRKVLAVGAAGGLGAVIAAACGATPTATPVPARSATATPRPTATPVPTQESLTVVFSIPTTVADPHVGPAKDRQWYRSVYDNVLRDDYVDFEIKNHLAESAEYDADGNLTVKLKEGVKFHGGETLSADDLIWNIKRIANEETGAWDFKRFNESAITKIEKLDPLTVKLHVNKPPKPNLRIDLARMYIMPASWAEGKSKEYFVSNANGSGPYKLTKFLAESVVEMEKFEDWSGGSSNIGFNKLIARFSDEEASRLAMLQRGEADIIWGLSPDFVEVAESAGMKVSSVNTQAPSYVALHTLPEENPVDPGTPNPLRDIRVRRAMNYMIDRDAILGTLLRGHGFPMQSWIPMPDMMGYVDPSELEQFNYDPDKARKLMAEAGYPNGFKNRIRHRAKGWIKGMEIGAAICDQLKDFGIETEQDALSSAIWVQSLFGKKTAPTHLELGWPAPTDPWLLPRGGLDFFQWIEDPEMVKIYDNTFQFTAADQHRELQKLNKHFWNSAHCIWLWHPAAIWGVQPDITWEAPGLYYGADFHGARFTP